MEYVFHISVPIYTILQEKKNDAYNAAKQRNCSKRDLANQLITHILYQIGSKQKKQIGCSGSLFSVRLVFHLVYQNLRLRFNGTEYEIRFDILDMIFFRSTISDRTLITVYLLPVQRVNS